MIDSIGFIYLGTTPGTSRTDYTVAVPYPSADGGAFETSRMVSAGRNALGEMVGEVVGRSIDKQNMAWNGSISPQKWWEINRFIEAGHFTFYCHYFNFNLGYWQTKQFYASDFKVTPYMVDKATGIPKMLKSASFNVIDCGVV
ncbi:MAG: hypothetical protein RR612_09145 [Oscillospiraceae bacterium]